jgi:hypothetical protein
MEKETLLATSPNLQDLRRLIAEYYFTGLDSITLVDGFIYKKDKKLSTQYYQKGCRWRFVLKI